VNTPPRTKRQTRRAAMQQQLEARRRAAQSAIERLRMADRQKHQAKAEAERVKREAERQRDQQRQQERERGRERQSSKEDNREGHRGYWEKSQSDKKEKQKKSRKEYHRDGSARSQPDGVQKATVSDGMHRHDTRWIAWQSTLPRPDAHTSAPFPHPKLFSRYLAAKSKAEDHIAAASYRDLMRRWHPDKFNQSIGRHLTVLQKAVLCPIAEAHCKQINDAFGK